MSEMNAIPAPDNAVYGPVLVEGEYPFCMRQFEVQGVKFSYGSTWLGNRWSNNKLDDGSGCLMRLNELESDNTTLRALVGELVEGLDSLASVYALPGESRNERYERVAVAFHKQTGYLPPGKDCRLYSPEERGAAYDAWFDAKAEKARALIAKAKEQGK